MTSLFDSFIRPTFTEAEAIRRMTGRDQIAAFAEMPTDQLLETMEAIGRQVMARTARNDNQGAQRELGAR